MVLACSCMNSIEAVERVKSKIVSVGRAHEVPLDMVVEKMCGPIGFVALLVQASKQRTLQCFVFLPGSPNLASFFFFAYLPRWASNVLIRCLRT